MITVAIIAQPVHRVGCRRFWGWGSEVEKVGLAVVRCCVHYEWKHSHMANKVHFFHGAFLSGPIVD